MSMDEREAILQQAHEARQRRDYPKAYHLYEALLQTSPDDPQILLEYGKAVYMEFEDLGKALRLFEKAFELDSTSVEALLWQADIAALGYGSGYRGAVSLYRQAIELDPTCADAYVGLGLQYQTPSVTLSLEETIDAFRTAIALDPHRADAYSNLGMALLDKKDMAGARAAFLHAIDLLEGTEDQKRIPAIRRYVEQIDRHEVITIRARVYGSPRYREFSEVW
jgi:tetratricopeptide (TPR) repeat protein